MRKRWIIAGLLLTLAIATAVSPVLAQGPVDRTQRAEVRFLEGMIDHHQMALDMAQDCLTKATTPAVLDVCQNVITSQSREIATMRGWLLVWYGIDYRPMSMMGMHHGGMMQDGMMSGGMMGGMMGGNMMQGGMMGGDAAQGGMMQGTATPAAPGDQHDQHHPGGTDATPMPGADTMQGGMMGGDMMQGGMMQGGMMEEPAGMMGMMAWLHQLSGVDYEIAWLEAMIDHHDDALHMSQRILNVTERPELQALAQGIIDAQTAEIEQMEALITEVGV